MQTKRGIGIADVIASTAIVAAVGIIAMPALLRADPDADQAAASICLSNLKQLALGTEMYVQDYDERLPCGANWNGSGSGWAEQIGPYCRSAAVFRCPSDTSPADSVSYGYNANLVRLTSSAPSAPTGMTFADLAAPADTVSLFEVTGNCAANKPPYMISNPAGSDTTLGPNWDIHYTDKPDAPVDGYSAAGRGTGDHRAELSGLGASNPAGQPVLQYATGPMSGSAPNSPYFAPARHQGHAAFAFLDGRAAMMDPGSISAGKTNVVSGGCGGKGVAASTACVDAKTFSGTFSLQ